MNKLFLFILFCGAIFGDDLPLSEQKTELLKLKREKIIQDGESAKNSWISPVILSTTVNKNKNQNLESQTNSAGLDWSQDLFRSGGISQSIAKAEYSKDANLLGISIEEATYLKQIYKLYTQISRDRLVYKQNELSLKNRDIDLFIIKAKYKVGSADISELNRITIDKDTVRTNLITLKNTLKNEEYELKKLTGDVNSDTLQLPNIPLLSQNDYIKSHLELLQYSQKNKRDEAISGVTRSAYLPKLTFVSSLGYTKFSSQLNNYQGNDYSYGAVVSMPLDVNMNPVIESSRLQHLQTQTAELDRKMELEKEYAMRIATIADYEEKIAVAKEMVEMYEELYNSTNAQVKAGYKSTYDLESLKNSVEIQKYEQEIHNKNILIEKISLYFDTQHEGK
ncbi:MAG: TolC family protein [Campylobacterales bacterium]|nr:TolC family protein [Campylobacterales bacterium]